MQLKIKEKSSKMQLKKNQLKDDIKIYSTFERWTERIK